MSEYKNQWVLDLVTQGNRSQNRDFRNNAVISASLDLQFWFGPVLFFYLSFSCHVKCLALYSVFQAMKHSSEEFIACHQQALWAQSLAGSGYLRFLWETPHTMSHFTLWCWSAADLLLAWREPLADRLGGQQSMVIPGGKAPQHCWGRLEAGRREQGSVCNQLIMLLNTLSKMFSLLAKAKDGVLSWEYFGSGLLCLFLSRAHKREGLNNIIPRLIRVKTRLMDINWQWCMDAQRNAELSA